MNIMNPKHKKACDFFLRGFDIDSSAEKAKCRPSAFASELATEGSAVNAYVNERIDRMMLSMTYFTGDCLKASLVKILVSDDEDSKDKLMAARLLLSVGLDPRDAMAKFETLLEAVKPVPQNKPLTK